MATRILLFLALACAALRPALSDDEGSAKYADIKRLMEMTGSANIAQQFATSSSRYFFQALKARTPDIPDRALTVMEKELNALFAEKLSAPGGLMEQVIPIYDRYFSHDEIRQLMQFYETPIGRKATQALPQIAAEGMAAGQRWGQSLAPEIEQRMRDALKREGLLPGTQ